MRFERKELLDLRNLDKTLLEIILTEKYTLCNKQSHIFGWHNTLLMLSFLAQNPNGSGFFKRNLFSPRRDALCGFFVVR